MKQEQFKNVYQQIYLTKKQKDEIWQRIEAGAKTESMPRKILLPTRAAVCLVALLMSGITVFAASELSLTDIIADAMNLLTQNKEELTDYQKNLYAQYGQALDNEFTLDNGTLKLDAVLYDGNHLLIPFRYTYHSNSDKYEKDINTFMHQSFRIVHNANQIDEIPSIYCIRNLETAEDRTISGSLLLVTDKLNSFASGDVVQIVQKTAIEETESYELLSEFTLENALEQHELTIDAENAAALEETGLSVEQMVISPLSLSYAGKGSSTRGLSASITVVLKDGSVVENSPTGSGYSISDNNRNNTSFSFYASNVFAAPVLLEDIAEIQIKDKARSVDIRIPFQ